MTYDFKRGFLGKRFKRTAGRLKHSRCFVIDWDKHENVIIYYPSTKEWGKYGYDKFCEEFRASRHKVKMPAEVHRKIGTLLNQSRDEFVPFPTKEFQEFGQAAFGNDWRQRRARNPNLILKLYVRGELRAERVYNPRTKERRA